MGVTVGILVSPAEPPAIRALGRTSAVAERWGADLLIPSLRLGLQRKEFSDLISSLTGDRLAKEVQQMKRLTYKVLIVEGRPAFNADGEWINGFQRFTQDQLWGVMLSLQQVGWMVLQTSDIRGTLRCIKEVIRWASKDSHTSLTTRPKHLVSKWGTRDDEDWVSWTYQSFPGIGATTARAMVKEIGMGLMWKPGIDEKRLQKIPGVGKERARGLMRALGQSVNGQASS